MAKVDKSKPLPEIFEALMAAAVADEVKALPAPAEPAPRSPEQDKQDCQLPAFLKEKHGLGEGAGQGDIPFDPPYLSKKEGSKSGTTTSGPSGNGGTTGTDAGSSAIETPTDSDEIYKHKLGEAVIPVKLLTSFLALFPGDRAYRVSQLANSHGEIDVADPVSKYRHVVVYDSNENLHRYERQ